MEHSKLVRDRETKGRRFLALAYGAAAELGRRLDAYFAPLRRPGQAVPNYPATIRDFARVVEVRLEELLAADRHDLEARQEERAVRARRRASQAELCASVVDIRDGICGFSGGRKKAAELFGIKGRTRRKGPVLVAQARALERLLRSGQPGKNAPRAKPFVGRWLAELGGRRRAVEAEDQRLYELEALGNRTLCDKERAIEVYDGAYQCGVGIVEVMYRAVGDGEMAKKVRPPVYRPDRVRAREAKRRAAAADRPAAGKAAREPSPRWRRRAAGLRSTLSRWLGKRIFRRRSSSRGRSGRR